MDDGYVPDWLIPGKVYDVLKWVALTVLPAIGFVVSGVGVLTQWPQAGIVSGIVGLIGTAIGAVIGASQLKAMGSKPTTVETDVGKTTEADTE